MGSLQLFIPRQHFFLNFARSKMTFERKKERDRQRDRETESEAETETERDRERENGERKGE